MSDFLAKDEAGYLVNEINGSGVNPGDEVREAWKVVRRENGRLYSAAIRWPKIQCEYSTEYWTVAPVGGVFCFQAEQWAEKAARNFGVVEPEIWRVVATGPQALPCCSVYASVTMAREQSSRLYAAVRNVWTGAGGKELMDNMIIAFAFWPPGTVAYKRVRLVERVL